MKNPDEIRDLFAKQKLQPQRIGEMTEGVILSALIKFGYSVMIPFGASRPYDLVVDDGETLLKVQCKTGRILRGSLTFPACSRNAMTGIRRSYAGRIDVFAVYCHSNDKIYWIPVGVAAKYNCTLRIDPTNCVRGAIRWAKDYEFKP